MLKSVVCESRAILCCMYNINLFAKINYSIYMRNTNVNIHIDHCF